MRSVNVNEFKNLIPDLRAGDRILLTGVVYTARDAAHRRIFELIKMGEPLPFEIDGSIIYYAGPTPAREGMASGSCGPTTSSRMDAFTPHLLDMGLLAMIGKGERSQDVSDAIIRNGAIYLCAVGGAGALIASKILESEEIAFNDLGCESVKRMIVQDLPLTVAIDSYGGNIFTEGREKFKKK